MPPWITDAFLNAGLLWWLPLALLPLVIHLLNRLRRRNIEWGAMRFLLRSHATRSRRILLEEIALLAIRVAALVALVFAVTRPFVRNPAFGGKGQSRQDVAIVLDASLSMALREDNVTRFERGVWAAGQIIDALEDGDTVSLLLAGAAVRPLHPRPEFLSTETRRALKRHLAAAGPLPGVTDMIRALDAAQNMLSAGKYAHKQIVVLTDGQARSWRGDEPRRWQFLRQMSEQAGVQPRIHALRVGGAPGRVVNAAVSRIDVDRRVVGTDLPVEIRATVVNTGTEPISDRSVELVVGDRRIAEQEVGRLGPQASHTLRFSHQFTRPGSHLIRARLTGEDQIHHDDGAYYALQVHDRLPVLLVDGAPAANPLDSGTGYLEAAMDPAEVEGEARVDYLVDARRVEWSRTEQIDPTGYKVVVLAGVPRLGERFLDRLRRFVREGGGLLIALGEQTDAEWYHNHLQATGDGLLPCRLDQPVGDAGSRQSSQTIAAGPSEHPALGVAADRSKTDIDRVHVFRWFRLMTPAEGTAEAVLRLANGEPFIVAKRVGRGRVLMVGSPLNIDWTNLPAAKVYVVMVHEMIYWLAQPTLPEWNVDAGQPMVALFEAAEAPPVAKVTDPAGEVTEIAGQPEGGSMVFRHLQTDLPGVYRWTVPMAGQARSYWFVVRPGADQAVLEPLSDRTRRDLAEWIGLRFSEDVDAIRRQLKIDVVGTEMWQALAAVVLVLLLAEVFLTRRIAAGRHGEHAGGVAFGQV